MLSAKEVTKKLLWVTFFAIVDQLFVYLAYQLASGGAVKVALGEGIVLQALFYPVIFKAVLYFLFAQSLCYGLLLAYALFCALQFQAVFKWFERRMRWMPTLIWLIAFSTAFVGNILYFPNSFYSAWITKAPDFYPVLFPRFVLLGFILLLSVVLMGLGALVIACWRYRQIFLEKKRYLSLLLIAFIPVGFALHAKKPQGSSPHSWNEPNIIVIGIDALRPDYITPENTPNLYAFLQDTRCFEHCVTPLARTFPAWVSILTGRYPKAHGARFNLDAKEFIHIDLTLPKWLQTRGYETWFAMDETRFSNIGEEYGFDHRLLPLEGVNDFLLGTLNDFPLTNLIVNTRLGAYLFPYSYANRAAYVTYRPTAFVKRVKRELPAQAELHKPLFLAMHLLLSHWPNEWAESRFSAKTSLPEKYLASIHAADKQWAQVMSVLKAKGLLNNAIVVVLSDHGEALGIKGDRQLMESRYLAGKDDVRRVMRYRYANTPAASLNFLKDYGTDTSYGHGTDVLSPSQYQTLFAWKRYGGAAFVVGKEASPVSLLDLAPTIVDLMGAPLPVQFQGVTLKSNLVSAAKLPSEQRAFFMENGYRLPEIETDTIVVSKVLQKAIQSYLIDEKTGLLTMRPEIERLGIKTKQFSVMKGDWQLAIYPPESTMAEAIFAMLKVKPPSDIHQSRYYLLNVRTGQWATDMNLPWVKHSPYQSLKQSLFAFYGTDLNA